MTWQTGHTGVHRNPGTTNAHLQHVTCHLCKWMNEWMTVQHMIVYNWVHTHTHTYQSRRRYPGQYLKSGQLMVSIKPGGGATERPEVDSVFRTMYLVASVVSVVTLVVFGVESQYPNYPPSHQGSSHQSYGADAGSPYDAGHGGHGAAAAGSGRSYGSGSGSSSDESYQTETKYYYGGKYQGNNARDHIRQVYCISVERPTSMAPLYRDAKVFSRWLYHSSITDWN